MPRKYIRFNYFTIHLVPQGLPNNMGDRNFEAPWDMRPLLDFLSVRRNVIQGDVNVGNYVAELDRESVLYDVRNGLYSFQVSKLRENNIPSIKSIGTPRVDITLEENQYIGEFVTTVFDPTYFTVGFQSNLYSLNVNQIEVYLTHLRRRFNDIQGNADQVELKVELRPIIDNTKIRKIRDSEIFRKITIKGADYVADALAAQGTLNQVSELVGQARGVRFEVTLSIGQAPKAESLDNDTIQEIIRGFMNIPNENDKPKIEIAAREDIDSPLEVVNLLEPRLTNIVSFEIENRQVIGHEMIHNNFVEEYTVPRATIARVNRPIV
ncbi:DUF6731 family protein [Lysinibacillus sp. F5]|uniref:DUF6731 family protein n=1 Tax=Lysinibacillus sp. F5 TaxID=1700846 RepID=UPI000738C298|nr:DUF6731 family protein [Lysinibacillus sp. F5]KUF29975.1 hypothetical protein AK833_18090 [Lysinibacillus sp. F5]